MTSSACAYTYYLYIRAACLITVRSLSKIEFFSLANGIFSESECKGTTFLRTGKIFHELFSGNLRKKNRLNKKTRENTSFGDIFEGRMRLNMKNKSDFIL